MISQPDQEEAPKTAAARPPRRPPEIISSLSEAWMNTKGVTLNILISVITANLVMGGGRSALHTLFPGQGIFVFIISIIAGSLLDIIGTYILATAVMLGVRQAIRLPVDRALVNNEIGQVSPELFKLIAVFIVGSQIPLLMLRIIPDTLPPAITIIFALLMLLIYALLTITLQALAVPLLIIRKIDFKTAAENALHKIRQNWFYIFSSMIIQYLLIAIPIGLGFAAITLSTYLGHLITFIVSLIVFYMVIKACIYLSAMYYTLIGVIFREVYGLKAKPPAAKTPANDPSPDTTDEHAAGA